MHTARLSFIIEKNFSLAMRKLLGTQLKPTSAFCKNIYLHSFYSIFKQYVYKIYKISLKTIVLLFLISFVCSCLTIYTLIVFRECILEKETYSCSWLKTGCDRNSPNRSNVCPCDLLIVILNESRFGNWCLRNLNGKN